MALLRTPFGMIEVPEGTPGAVPGPTTDPRFPGAPTQPPLPMQPMPTPTPRPLPMQPMPAPGGPDQNFPYLPGTPPPPGTFHPQVIVRARNPATGETGSFPNPGAVPPGWVPERSPGLGQAPGVPTQPPPFQPAPFVPPGFEDWGQPMPTPSYPGAPTQPPMPQPTPTPWGLSRPPSGGFTPVPMQPMPTPYPGAPPAPQPPPFRTETPTQPQPGGEFTPGPGPPLPMPEWPTLPQPPMPQPTPYPGTPLPTQPMPGPGGPLPMPPYEQRYPGVPTQPQPSGLPWQPVTQQLPAVGDALTRAGGGFPGAPPQPQPQPQQPQIGSPGAIGGGIADIFKGLRARFGTQRPGGQQPGGLPPLSGSNVQRQQPRFPGGPSPQPTGPSPSQFLPPGTQPTTATGSLAQQSQRSQVVSPQVVAPQTTARITPSMDRYPGAPPSPLTLTPPPVAPPTPMANLSDPLARLRQREQDPYTRLRSDARPEIPFATVPPPVTTPPPVITPPVTTPPPATAPPPVAGPRFPGGPPAPPPAPAPPIQQQQPPAGPPGQPPGGWPPEFGTPLGPGPHPGYTGDPNIDRIRDAIFGGPYVPPTTPPKGGQQPAGQPQDIESYARSLLPPDAMFLGGSPFFDESGGNRSREEMAWNVIRNYGTPEQIASAESQFDPSGRFIGTPPAGPPEFDPSTLAPEQLSRVQDFEKRITDFAAGLEAQGIPKDQQEFQAFRQFGPEMGRLANELGGNVPGWFREFAGKAQTAFQDPNYYQTFAVQDPFTRGPFGGNTMQENAWRQGFDPYTGRSLLPPGMGGGGGWEIGGDPWVRTPTYGGLLPGGPGGFIDQYLSEMGIGSSGVYDFLAGGGPGPMSPGMGGGGMPDWMNNVLGLIPGPGGGFRPDPFRLPPGPGEDWPGGRPDIDFPPPIWPFPYPEGPGPQPPRPPGPGEDWSPTPTGGPPGTRPPIAPTPSGAPPGGTWGEDGGGFDWRDLLTNAARMGVPGLLGWLLGGGGGGSGGGGGGGFNFDDALSGAPMGRLNQFFSAGSTIPQSYDEFYKQLTGQQTDASPFGNQLNEQLRRQLEGGAFPQQVGGNLGRQLGSGSDVLPFLQTQLGSLQRTGLPGQRLLQDPGGPLNLNELLQGSSGLLNTGGGGGLIPGLQHILNQGLPGQRQVEGLVPSQLGLGEGIQGTVGQSLQDLIRGGGLSEDFVRATTERVLDPALKRFEGQQVAQLGGVGSLQSGQSQDRRRDLISDFNNDLIRQGFQNMLGFQGQGLQLGQQGIANALGAFGAVPQNVSPFMDITSQLQRSLGDQSLNRFNVLGSQGLNALNTFGSLGQIPFQQAQDINRQQLSSLGLGLGREQFTGNFAQNNVNSAINYINSLMGNQTQRMGLNDAASAARFQALFGGATNLIAPILDYYLNRGRV